jgi:hypothetical protein
MLFTELSLTLLHYAIASPLPYGLFNFAPVPIFERTLTCFYIVPFRYHCIIMHYLLWLSKLEYNGL